MPNGIDPSGFSAADQVALLRRIQETIFPVVEGFTGGRPGESPLTRAALQVFQEQTLPIIQQQFQLQGLQGSPALGVATGRALSSTLVPLIQEDLRNRLQAAGLPIQVGGLSAEFGRQALQERLSQAEIMSREVMLGRQLTAAEQAQVREISARQAEQAAQLEFGRQTAIGEFGNVPTVQRRFGEEQLTQSAAQLAANIAGAEQQRGLQGLQVGGQLILGLADPLAQAARLAQMRQEMALRSIGTGGEFQRSIAQETLDRAQADFLRRQALAEQATTGIFGGSVLPPLLQSSGTSTTRGQSSK